MTSEDEIETLKEYIRTHPCRGFKPVPCKNKTGNQIEWYWSNRLSYADPVYHNGVWVGTVHREFNTKEATGVTIFLEQVK